MPPVRQTDGLVRGELAMQQITSETHVLPFALSDVIRGQQFCLSSWRISCKTPRQQDLTRAEDSFPAGCFTLFRPRSDKPNRGVEKEKEHHYELNNSAQNNNSTAPT